MQSIVKFAEKLICDGITIPSIESYNDDFSCEINGLYIDVETKRNLLKFYNSILTSRKKLAESKNSAFSSYILTVEEYLESIKDLFTLYFKICKTQSSAINLKIISQIVESDIQTSDNNEIRINFGNPLIIESLLISYLQIQDFKQNFGSIDKEGKYTIDDVETLGVLGRELIINKIDRLFRDIIVLYNKEFYRITHFNEEQNNFKAIKEDCLKSIETISATRLYEKIVKLSGRGADNTEKEKKVLIIGSTIVHDKGNGVRESSIDLLKSMFSEKESTSITVDVIDKKEDISEALRQFKLNNLIERYDKVFILDCPEIYYPIELAQMRDGDLVIKRAEQQIKKMLDIDPVSHRRDFFNKNGFAAIYYRVQNYLINMSRENTRKSRKINTEMLDYIKELINRNPQKEVYVYISNNHDFRNELYDMYNFTRLERYNSKDCRIIRFGKYPKPKFNFNACELKITFYKILKMLSNSVEFYKKCTTFEDFLSSYNIAKYTRIFIQYGTLLKKLNKSNPIQKFNLHINIFLHPEVCASLSEEIKNKYKNKVELFIKEAFNFKKPNTKNYILDYCFKKAMANVFSGCSHSFNDLLFYHLYMRAVLGSDEIDFNISEIKFFEEMSEDFNDIEETSSYSYKRVAYFLMEALDGDFYTDTSIIGHYRRASINEEKLLYYSDHLLSACEELGYINSRLYRRLNKYY